MIHFVSCDLYVKREIETKYIYIFILLTDGPDRPVLSPSAESVNITEGSNLGPIVCSAECRPNCDYVWKHRKFGGRFSDIDSSQSLEIYSVTKQQSGIYRCRVNHPNDTSRCNRTDVIVTVHCK
jgi:hypothetical protein